MSRVYDIVWQNDWDQQNCFHCFHCFGRIWKLTVFTLFWLTPLQNSQKIVEKVSFYLNRCFRNSENCCASAYSLLKTHCRYSTFIGPPFEVLGSRATKMWSEEGTVPTEGVEETVCARATHSLDDMPTAQKKQWKRSCGFNRFVILRVYGLGVRMKDVRFRVQSLRLRMWHQGVQVTSLGLRI